MHVILKLFAQGVPYVCQWLGVLTGHVDRLGFSPWVS